MSPYILFFGREPPVPPFAQSRDETANEGPTFVGVREGAIAVRDEANRRAEEHRAKEAATYNRKVKHTPLEVGDRAWEQVQVRHGKIPPKWDGPVTVERRASHPSGVGTTYDIERDDETRHRRNYEQLKKVNARYENAMSIPLPPKPQAEQLPYLPLLCFAMDEPADLLQHDGSPPRNQMQLIQSPPRTPFSPTLITQPRLQLPDPMLPPPDQPALDVTDPQSGTEGRAALEEDPDETEVKEEVNVDDPPVEVADGENPVDDFTALGSAIESASEHDIGFHRDLIEAGSSGLQASQDSVPSSLGPTSSQREALTNLLRPVAPPPHPLIAQNARSDNEYEDAEEEQSPASSPNSPNQPPQRMAVGRGHRPINVNIIDLESLSSNDEEGFAQGLSTPLMPVATHRTEDVVFFDENADIRPGYTIQTAEGERTIRRVTDDEDADDEETGANDQPEDQRGAAGHHNLRNKMRRANTRSREGSSEPYPKSKVNKARQANEETIRNPVPPRGPGGRFRKKKPGEENQ